MPSVIDYPTKKRTSVLTTLRFQLLIPGSRVPTTYAITAEAAQAPVTDISIDSGSPVTAGDTAITLSAPITLPNHAKIAFANGVNARLTSAAAATATLAVAPIKDPLTGEPTGGGTAIPASTPGVYNHGTLNAGDEYLSVEPIPKALFPGEELFFGPSGANTKVTVATYAPAGATVLECLPLPATISDGDSASTFATISIAGATDASPTSQPKIVDATTFADGAGYSGLTTGTNRTLNFTFQDVEGDPGASILKQMLYIDRNFDREIYAILKRNAGFKIQPETYEGACIMTQGDQSSAVQDIITLTANLQFQGGSFKYTPTDGDYNMITEEYTPPGLAV
ncbi:hypothetical protein U2F10_03020 [Leptothoe sp. EHU-05/26/07-4]